MTEELLRGFAASGHDVQAEPDGNTDVIFATARFGESLNWRNAALFISRRRYSLSHTPTVITLVGVSPERFRATLDHFERALNTQPPDPDDFAFPGLAPQAYRTLLEQGWRGGPILALERLVQTQAKSIRVILIVGDDHPLEAYHFDLVGAYPRSDATDPSRFYEDIVLRVVTAVCTHQVSEHKAADERYPRQLWDELDTPAAMQRAGAELGRREFFTEIVVIGNLTHVPAVGDAVASQYSEGCFATWDPVISALIATVTGSARPVDKGHITEDDLAVVVGVRADGKGALVRHVEGKRNDPPSSESVEMMRLDGPLPTISLGSDWPVAGQVPVVRSKLHVHRAVGAYDPNHVECVPMDAEYHHYLVTCGTAAQAEGITQAFARSQTLQHPGDPRHVVFTVLPGHGSVLVEKWVPGTVPFQTIWEYVDAGYLEVESIIPQGPMQFLPDHDGILRLVPSTGIQ